MIAKKAGQAIHILDRFHIMTHLSRAIDKVRAEEARELTAAGYEPVLTKIRWLFSKRPENLTTRKTYGFKTCRAAEIALYHALGALPVPETTHEFF